MCQYCASIKYTKILCNFQTKKTQRFSGDGVKAANPDHYMTLAPRM